LSRSEQGPEQDGDLGQLAPDPLHLLAPWLDAHLLLGWSEVPSEAIEPFFHWCYPGASFAELVATFADEGLLESCGVGRWAVPQERRAELAHQVGRSLLEGPLPLPGRTVSAADLLSAFSIYLQEISCLGPGGAAVGETTWGGATFCAGERQHYVLVRPFPVLFGPLVDAFVLTLCPLPLPAVAPLSERYVGHPAWRRSLAFADVGRAWKVNLTRSEVFVHLERFLWQTYRLRLIPAPALTEALLAAGMLVLEKG
jgi:hypothetical protein